MSAGTPRRHPGRTRNLKPTKQRICPWTPLTGRLRNGVEAPVSLQCRQRLAQVAGRFPRALAYDALGGRFAGVGQQLLLCRCE